MALPPAHFACSRFGMGPRPGEVDTIGDDPQRWLLAQIGPPGPQERALDDLGTHLALWTEALASRAAQETAEEKKATHVLVRRIIQREAAARLAFASGTDAPFRERWVRFWSRHFAVSAGKSRIAPMVGAYEREAIRPHAFGPFGTLLKAAVTHPAMLIYLDNDASIGPLSRAGRKRSRGLNENLAREVLELHTLGVDGGYTQHDVQALAAILTGWGIFRPTPDGLAAQGTRPVTTGMRFRPGTHEPGPKELLGVRVREGGAAELDTALTMLANHPRTAHHLATRLAVHFVADSPPSHVIDAIAAEFTRSEGNLGSVARFMVTHGPVWEAAAAPTHRKLRTPEDLVVATARALNLHTLPRQGELGKDWAHGVARALKPLGQPDFEPPSPAGWPDQAPAWSGADQLLRRIEFAETMARRHRGQVTDPPPWAADILGPRAPTSTLAAVAEAPEHPIAVAIVLASPAFQWR